MGGRGVYARQEFPVWDWSVTRFFPAWSRAGCEMPFEFSASPGSVAIDRFS